MQRYVEVKPCSLPDNGEYAVWLKVGNQSFQLSGEFPKEDAEWMKGMLVKALDHIYSDMRGAATAADERLIAAAERAGITYMGCDTPDALADKVVEMRGELAALKELKGPYESVDAKIHRLEEMVDIAQDATIALTAELAAANEQIAHLLEENDGLAKLYAEASNKLVETKKANIAYVNEQRTQFAEDMSKPPTERIHCIGCTLPYELAKAREALERIYPFILKVSKQIAEKPDYWTSCGQCDNNRDEAEELVEIAQATLKEGK